MTLENSMALARVWVPYSDAGIQTPGSNSSAVKSNGIDLTEMARKGSVTPSFRNTPYTRHSVIASGDDDIPVDGKASDTRLVADQDIPTCSRNQIPYPKGAISGP